MAKLIRLKLYICDFYENLDQKTMEVIIHRALNGTAGSAMTDIFEMEEKAITWADDNPINQLNATQETWDEQFGSKNTQAARIAELDVEKAKLARKCVIFQTLMENILGTAIIETEEHGDQTAGAALAAIREAIYDTYHELEQVEK